MSNRIAYNCIPPSESGDNIGRWHLGALCRLLCHLRAFAASFLRISPQSEPKILKERRTETTRRTKADRLGYDPLKRTHGFVTALPPAAVSTLEEVPMSAHALDNLADALIDQFAGTVGATLI